MPGSNLQASPLEMELDLAIQASVQAGNEILKVYSGNDFGVEYKKDLSPLTIADRLAHETIHKILSSSPYPILSEEGKEIPYETRRDWWRFWLVDPLDGTKEFISRNGDFTVNIALIQNGLPILGVIFVPVSGWLFFGEENRGSGKLKLSPPFPTDSPVNWNMAEPLHGKPAPGSPTAVASRSHSDEITNQFLDECEIRWGKLLRISRGSSLKFCLMAEGEAWVYPRFGPTMEWDTAAGHAIAQFAGCRVTKPENPNLGLTYNKPSLLNPAFIVYGKGIDCIKRENHSMH